MENGQNAQSRAHATLYFGLIFEEQVKVQKIRLICIDEAVSAALAKGKVFFESTYGVGIGDHLGLMRDIVAQTLRLAEARPREAAFGGYLIVDGAVMVGTGGFRNGPAENGTVELAYSTFAPFEGKGYATATARALIDIAAAHPGVRRIIAHTLATPGPSPRILEKVGMRHLGEVIDPEDGVVWEFEIDPVRSGN